MKSILEQEFKEFFHLLDEGKLPINYSPRLREFSINLSRTSAVQLLNFCPWSGKKFPRSVRTEYCDILESRGIDPPIDSKLTPDDMRDESWWIERGL